MNVIKNFLPENTDRKIYAAAETQCADRGF